MDKLRILFEKSGSAIYISHLDLMRTMQRAFLRAGYPLKYSEGFNPHAIISIALPLSVGVSSRCEIMDFQLKDYADLREMPARLNAALPQGIKVTQAYEAQRKINQLKWLRIRGVFEYDNADDINRAEELGRFFAREQIVITKKTKRGMGESDIAPAIKEIRFESDDNANVSVEAVISAQEPTLNPENLVNALRQLAPNLVPDFDEFERIEVYDEKMEVFR